jgi:exodeoxyribonuclease VII small subunit
MSQKEPSSRKFEAALQELARLVEELESGDLSLEDSLAAFEKGVSLVRYCNEKLTEIEKKVEILVKDKDGKLQLRAFESVSEPNEEDD